MNDSLNQSNYSEVFGAWLKEKSYLSEKSIRKMCKAIGCSPITLTRLLSKQSYPTHEMLQATGTLMYLDIDGYKALNDAQKEKIFNYLKIDAGDAGGKTSAGVGAGIGLLSIPFAISSAGITGLSAAGITTGLAAMGLGAGMVGGVMAAAAIPVAAAGVGYVAYKGFKSLFGSGNEDTGAIDSRWEMNNLAIG